MIYYRLAVLILVMVPFAFACSQQSTPVAPKNIAVIAYYSGDAATIDRFPVKKLTHIIFSFGHLKDNRLNIDDKKDTATIHKLVSLKKQHPSLKIILSLGGWGGCEFCSPAFSSSQGRNEFASSVRELTAYFKTDGIDLDWEYPSIEGHPGHAFHPSDRQNFTSLVKVLRDSLGTSHELSFAAGGFDKFLRESVEWDKIMPMLDKVNIMSYDLVGGYSKVTGHHTPLYSTKEQKQSADNAIHYLDSIGVPLDKVILGAAFYARIWEQVPAVNNGLYQPGVFKSFVASHRFPNVINKDSGFVFFRDPVAKATYAYNARRKLFATFDDKVSVADKTKYVLAKGLGGIMFWELSLDLSQGGLLDAIDGALK
jgi:chitinase